MLAEWNQQNISEFWANDGKVGGPFAGALMKLLHHVGRKSGTQYVTPLVCQPKDGPDDSIYVFAAFAGAPEHPAWFWLPRQPAGGRGAAVRERGGSTAVPSELAARADPKGRLEPVQEVLRTATWQIVCAMTGG